MSALVAPFTQARRRPEFDGRTTRTDAALAGGPRNAPTSTRRRTVIDFVIPALLGDSHEVAPMADRLAAYLDERVRCSSPALFTTSRTELVSALVDGDDVITHATVQMSDATTNGGRSYVEWELRGRFTHPAFLRDDRLIEASGRSVVVDGVMVVRFVSDRIGDIRCFYDAHDLDRQLCPET